MPKSFDGFSNLWPGADPAGRMRGTCIHPLAIFKNIFDVYQWCSHGGGGITTPLIQRQMTPYILLFLIFISNNMHH